MIIIDLFLLLCLGVIVILGMHYFYYVKHFVTDSLLFLALTILRRIIGIRIISDLSAVLIYYYSVLKIKKKVIVKVKVEMVKQAKLLPRDRVEGPTGAKLKVRIVPPLRRVCLCALFPFPCNEQSEQPISVFIFSAFINALCNGGGPTGALSLIHECK